MTDGGAAAGDSDYLDDLLDSALEDFKRIDLAKPAPAPAPVRGLGMGMGLPELGAKRKGKGKREEKPAAKKDAASEALEQLMRETQEAVRGIGGVGAPKEGAGEADAEAMMEGLVKQFEDLAGTQDMDSVVHTMMQQLLSKEILHEPMREIGEKYPKWLEEHKDGLTREEYDRYQRQLELILKLDEVYENEPDNFQKIVDLMQKMQECGQPPSDIVQELAPGLDLSNLDSQLSPELLGSAPNCCIM